MLMRPMESFGVKIATFQHVLEGYKIADEIAPHGAGGSTFSDWWAYKFEVYDAIPYNGSLMRDRGVVVSFNSDSSELARRLYLEAAKAVKYGGTPEAEALKFVTLNPAKQLHIDRWSARSNRAKTPTSPSGPNHRSIPAPSVCKPGSMAKNISIAQRTRIV